MKSTASENMQAAEAAVSVVIPVYNEEATLPAVVKDVERICRENGWPAVIRVVDDGSERWPRELEQTLQALPGVTVEHLSPNRGKGAALAEVLPRLNTELAVVIDADGEYLAQDVATVLEPLLNGEADWVMGSRYGFGRTRSAQYRSAYLFNRLIGCLFRRLSPLRLNDPLTGLYAFRSRLVRPMTLKQQRFAYTPELLWKVYRHTDVRWKEVPAAYRFRTYGQGKKIRWWEAFTILYAAVRYRWLD